MNEQQDRLERIETYEHPDQVEMRRYSKYSFVSVFLLVLLLIMVGSWFDLFPSTVGEITAPGGKVLGHSHEDKNGGEVDLEVAESNDMKHTHSKHHQDTETHIGTSQTGDKHSLHDGTDNKTGDIVDTGYNGTAEESPDHVDVTTVKPPTDPKDFAIEPPDYIKFKSCDPGTVLLVIVRSKEQDFELRQVIRDTWGSGAYGERWPYDTANLDIVPSAKLLFVIEIGNREQMFEGLDEEHTQFHDVFWIDLSKKPHQEVKPWEHIKTECHKIPFALVISADAIVVVNMPYVMTTIRHNPPRSVVYGRAKEDAKNRFVKDFIDEIAILSTTSIAIDMVVLQEEDQYNSGFFTKHMVTMCKAQFVALPDWMGTLRPNANCDFRNNKFYLIEKIKHVHQLDLFWRSLKFATCGG